MRDLNNRVAVVTGASAGIGRAISLELARAGCHVALLARNQESLQQVADQLAALGARALPISCDLGEPQQVRQSLAEVARQLGPVDILINNVGAGTFKPLHRMSNEECNIAVRLPLLPAITAIHAVIPCMRQRGCGHIVNITSPAGIFPLPYMVPYTSTRHAMVGLSQSLHEELRGTGVGVSLVCPAQVNTGYFERNDADLGWYPKISSLFPVSEPERVARKVRRAIEKDQREVVFPALLWLAIAAFRKAPRLAITVFRALGLWGPSRRVIAADASSTHETMEQPMNVRVASVSALKKLYSSLPVPDAGMRHGFFRASFIGPFWLRMSGRPTLELTGLPGWQGKRFITGDTATNVLLRKGERIDALNMSVANITSYVDGSAGVALRYGAEAPIPWRWVRDELRAIDGNTLLGITFVDLPVLRHFPMPFLLERDA